MKRAAWRLGIPLGIYLVLGAIFARLTELEGLVTPRGAPNLGVMAVGASYLVMRVFVLLVLPGVAVWALLPSRR